MLLTSVSVTSLPPSPLPSLPLPDSSLHFSLAQVCHAISEHSLDAAQSLLADFLPLVFLAMHGRVTPEGTPSSSFPLPLSPPTPSPSFHSPVSAILSLKEPSDLSSTFFPLPSSPLPPSLSLVLLLPQTPPPSLPVSCGRRPGLRWCQERQLECGTTYQSLWVWPATPSSPSRGQLRHKGQLLWPL